MSYSVRDLDRPLCRCGQLAAVEIVDGAGVQEGRYCRACARGRLTYLLQRVELRAAKGQP